MTNRGPRPASWLVAALVLGMSFLSTAGAASPVPPVNRQTASPSPARQQSATPPWNGPGAAANKLAPNRGLASAQLPLPSGSRLSLKQAISIALEYHPRAAQASAESAAAEEQVGEARSYLGPQVYGLSEYLRSTENGIGNTGYYNLNGVLPRITGTNHDLPPNDTSQRWDTSNNYVGGAAVSQYLLDFGRRRGFVAERRFEAGATLEQQQLVDLQLIFEVSQRYFNLLETRQLVRVFEKAVEQRKYHLHEAEVKADAGLRPQLDVYLTEAEVQRAQLHLVDARNAEDDAVVALDNGLGLGGSSPNYQLVDVLTYSPVTEQIDSLLRDAMRLRPDMKALQDQARAMGRKSRNTAATIFRRSTALPAIPRWARDCP